MTELKISANVRARRLTAGHWILKIALALAFSPATVSATPPSKSAALRSDSDASSSRAAREEALRQIPWQQLTPQYQRIAQSVISDASIYRKLPTRIIDCDADLFTFLLQHPEVVIDVWRIMGISQVSLARAPDGTYQGTDGAGTSGMVKYLYSSWGQQAQNCAVVYADGAYSGSPFVMPLKAQSIMLLRSNGVREINGRQYITVRVDSFVRIEQLGVEIIAKTVQPWITKTADQNLIETLTFVSTFSRTAEKNPEGMQRLASRLSTIDPKTRTDLISLCYRTAERYARIDSATSSGEFVAHRATSVVSNP